MTYTRPMMTVNGRQRLVSRVTMERALGRPLVKDEIVHHLNENPSDNRLENLQIVSRAEHLKLHPEIGVTTRLKKKWRLDPVEIAKQFETKSASLIASEIGCSINTVLRVLRPQLANGRPIRALGLARYSGKRTRKGKVMNKFQVAQGDVLIESCDPKKLKGLKETKPTVALGENTGHHHSYDEKRSTGFYKEDDALIGAQPIAGGGRIMADFIRVHKADELTHQEHGSIPHEPGTYERTPQMEWDELGMARPASD